MTEFSVSVVDIRELPKEGTILARYTLRENSSGQQKGQKHISKRTQETRIIFFKVMVPLIRL
ncbi:hypothetical protein [Metabacillus litoralis]|uniref:hypothetical protein n=1 Tax=Metabacillus litoralis TaxID=152268 RepID=UPI0012EEAF9E|nr:hypothetical protein [Metabacillus litoralis]